MSIYMILPFENSFLEPELNSLFSCLGTTSACIPCILTAIAYLMNSINVSHYPARRNIKLEHLSHTRQMKDCDEFVLCRFSQSRTTLPRILFPAQFQVSLDHKRHPGMRSERWKWSSTTFLNWEGQCWYKVLLQVTHIVDFLLAPLLSMGQWPWPQLLQDFLLQLFWLLGQVHI